MVRRRPGGCGQVPAEEAPQRERNVQDVMMIQDMQRKIAYLTHSLAVRYLQRQVADLTRHLAAREFKDCKAFDQDSQPAFEIRYDGDSGGGNERYGGASLKTDVSDYSGTLVVEHIYGDAIFYKRISSSNDSYVDWNKPPIYDNYGDEDEDEALIEEDLIVEDDEYPFDVHYEVISDPSQVISPSSTFVEDEVTYEDDEAKIELKTSLIFPIKPPSFYCDPFLVGTFIHVSRLNSRTSSLEEGVTDAGQISWKFSSVTERLFRSKRRIRGRIEGLEIWVEPYIILSGNDVLKITRDLSRAPPQFGQNRPFKARNL